MTGSARTLGVALVLFVLSTLVSVPGARAAGSDDTTAAVAARAAGAKRARAVRGLLVSRVGSIEALRVPATNEALPQPRLDDGSADPRYAITEAKRFLGKLLYFDPVRTTRIHTEFGGVEATARKGSCGSCHLGEVAGKAGQIINLHLGGEGRGFTDADGLFHVRRRLQPGFVDVIPTGQQFVSHGTIVRDGRFDAVDSVPRISPSMIGFAFNNRLLLGGKAGEPESPDNPNHLPTGENLVEIAFNVHRMLETQSAALQESPVYVKLFEDAFPAEAATYAASHHLDDLINDDTVERAVAAFLRTVVTRNTPWDRFLAGDDSALTKSQLRGAKLFAADATVGGANCISCHSGPMLNKQLGDEAGVLVEENFHNLGIGDHPLQKLGAIALEDPNHHDIGRGEITLRPEDNFKFRTMTVRQLKDSGGQLMHSALFGSVREVVDYYNVGIPQDPAAAAAGNLSERFTHPRGVGTVGLGLSEKDVVALVDFLENGLYDPAFARFDASSTTDSFELNERDLTYSANRPDLAALGAVDGLMPSGLCVTSDDALTRRDRGLEFLDVTDKLAVNEEGVERANGVETHHLLVTNIGSATVDTHLLMCFRGLAAETTVMDAEGTTTRTPNAGLPYLREFVPNGEIGPAESMRFDVRFATTSPDPVAFGWDFLSGQGKP